MSPRKSTDALKSFLSGARSHTITREPGVTRLDNSEILDFETALAFLGQKEARRSSINFRLLEIRSTKDAFSAVAEELDRIGVEAFSTRHSWLENTTGGGMLSTDHEAALETPRHSGPYLYLRLMSRAFTYTRAGVFVYDTEAFNLDKFWSKEQLSSVPIVYPLIAYRGYQHVQQRR
jgi:hypothetical protein